MTQEMKFQTIEIQHYLLQLKRPLITAHSEFRVREGLWLKGTLEDQKFSFGEVAPLSGFSADTLSQNQEQLLRSGDLRHLKIPRSPAELKELLQSFGNIPSALKFGLETLFADAAAQLQGVSLACWLNPRAKKRVKINALVSGNLAEMLEQAREKRSQGFSCMKLKLSGDFDTDLERIRLLQKTVPDSSIRLDANQSYSYEGALQLVRQIDAAQIEYLEEPLQSFSVEQYQALSRKSKIPIALDESLQNSGVLQSALQSAVAKIFIVKPTLLGGYFALQELLHEARKNDIDLVLTSTLESGVGVSACLHIAAALEISERACGLDTESLFAEKHMSEDLVSEQGSFGLPRNPGLGRWPEPAPQET